MKYFAFVTKFTRLATWNSIQADIYISMHLSDAFVKSEYSNSSIHPSKVQFGAQYLAVGHLDMQAREIKPATFQKQDVGSTSEPQPP